MILVCFSVDNPTSLLNVHERWIGEVKHYCKDIPIVLVACKKDLRENENVIQQLKNANEAPVSTEHGMAASKKIGAAAYWECLCNNV